jgi:hypothetical protein
MIFAAPLLAQLLTGAGSALIGKLLPSAPTNGASAADFSALLDKARQGQLESGQPVSLGAVANLQLTPDQFARLGQAADRAQAAGMSTALVFLDGQALKLDVGSRTVTGVVDAAATTVAGIDGVISAPPSSLSQMLKPADSQPQDSAAQTQPLLQQQLLLGRLNGARSLVYPRMRGTSPLASL